MKSIPIAFDEFENFIEVPIIIDNITLGDIIFGIIM